MNVNLSPSSDSPKVKSAPISESSKTSKSDESEGLFSKLAALIMGDDKKPTEKSQHKAASDKANSDKVSSDKGSTEKDGATKLSKAGDSVNAGSTKDAVDEDTAVELGTEALLTESDEGQFGAAELATKASKSDSTDQAAKLDGAEGNIDESIAKEPSLSRDSAAQLMSSGDKVLGRLKESNQALKAANGKELPPQSDTGDDADILAGVAGAYSVMSQKGVGVSDGVPTDNLEQGVSQAISGGQGKLVDPAQMASGELVSAHLANRGQTSDLGQQSILGQQPAELDGSIVSSGLMSTDNLKGPDGQMLADTQPVDDNDVISDEVLLAALAGGAVSPLLASDATIQAVDNTLLTEAELSKLATTDMAALSEEQRNVVLNALESGRVPEGEEGQLIRQLAGKPIVVSDGPLMAAELDPTALTTAGAISGIPATLPSDNSVSDGISTELMTPPTLTNDKLLEGKQNQSAQQSLNQQSVSQQVLSQQQASLAANIHQQMQAERVAAAVQNSAAPPVDPSAILNQSMTAAQLAAVNQGNEIPVGKAISMAGAALGAKSLLGDSSRESVKGGESSFASQLSHLTGQQASSLAAIKAEVQQTPVHINKEASADQMAEKVNMMMSKNLKNIDIRLDPPELGKMQIRMNMNGDMTTVHFTVANQHARDAVEQSMPRLREMLSQQGVQLGETAVQQQSSQQQGGYAASGRGQSNGSSESKLGGLEQNIDPDVKVDLNVATKRDGISFYA
jgi:flagellar hook-length control protein FliK